MLDQLNRFGRFLAEVWFFFARAIYFRWYNARYIIILGGPGAGKGTMAGMLEKRLGIKHLNMGNLLRAEIANGTIIGNTWKTVIEEGKLVPDLTILKLLHKELKKREYRNGAILDGIPRTLAQAAKLELMLLVWGHKIDTIAVLDVSEEDLLERLPNRRICSNKKCGRTFHLTLNPPKSPGVCDFCQSELIQRADDAPAVVRDRLAVFRQNVHDIRFFYANARNVVTVKTDNNTSVEDAFNTLLFAIEQVG